MKSDKLSEQAWKLWADSLLARDQIEKLVIQQMSLRYSGDSIDWFLIGALCVSYTAGMVD